MASPALQPSVDPDVDTQNADRPLRIIAINEDGTNFRLIEPNLQAIIKRVEAINANHVAIVSVVGAFRTGKSFLLDLFLRYLRFTSTDQPDAAPKEGLPAWLQSGGERLMEGNAAAKAEEGNSKPGFDWRPGKERTTTGIWMYGTPFARTLPSGEKIGVILMDTQGMFDMQTDIRLTAAIFGLSTLISSYQIYNITKQIQEDYLEQLDYFTQFSLVALKEFDKASERMKAKGVAEAKEAQAKQPFQTVELLVRDWQNFADDNDVEKCISEMQPVLDEAMRTQSKTAGATRDQIRAAFENINCFMLPHPGTAMIKLQYKGDINVIEKSFINLVDIYVHRVFEEKLVMKKIQGRAVSPHALLNYIKAYADVFKDGQMPKPMTLVEAMSLTTNLVSRDDALLFYKSQMNQHTSGSGYVPKQDLFDLNQRERVAALEKYDELACFGSEEAIAATRKDLEKQLDEAWDVVQKANEYKIQGSLAPFIIPFIAAMLALILDTVTDYTCDAWSDNCRKLSHWSALLYYVVFAALGYKLFMIYREQGPLAVGVGFMGLGQAAALKVSESIEDIQIKLRSKVAIAPSASAETKKNQ